MQRGVLSVAMVGRRCSRAVAAVAPAPHAHGGGWGGWRVDHLRPQIPERLVAAAVHASKLAVKLGDAAAAEAFGVHVVEARWVFC